MIETRAEHIAKHRGENRVVDDVSFEVLPGELLGPSGGRHMTVQENVVFGLRMRGARGSAPATPPLAPR